MDLNDYLASHLLWLAFLMTFFNIRKSSQTSKSIIKARLRVYTQGGNRK